MKQSSVDCYFIFSSDLRFTDLYFRRKVGTILPASFSWIQGNSIFYIGKSQGAEKIVYIRLTYIDYPEYLVSFSSLNTNVFYKKSQNCTILH